MSKEREYSALLASRLFMLLSRKLDDWRFVAIPFGHCFRYAQVRLRFASAVGYWILDIRSPSYPLALSWPPKCPNQQVTLPLAKHALTHHETIGYSYALAFSALAGFSDFFVLSLGALVAALVSFLAAS